VVRLPGRNQHALAGVYALNALAGVEQDRFERHMDGCQACLEEVRSLYETASGLALAVAAPPPPGFRERVLAAVPSVPQLPAQPVADQAAPDTGQDTARHSARPRPAHRRPARKVRRPGLAGLLPKIAIGVAAVATAVAVFLGVRLNSVQSQLSVSKAEQLALTRLLNTPGVRVLAARTKLGGDATAVHVPGQTRVVVLAKDLPVLPGSKVYQVWLIGAKVKGVNHIRSAGFLARTAAGGTTILVASGVRIGDTVGITIEPAGGSKQPTTVPFVALQLAR